MLRRINKSLTILMFVISCVIAATTETKGENYPFYRGDCEHDWYIKCGDGIQCTSKYNLCDGIQDCNDGSDEGQLCSEYKCRDGFSKCADGLECIPDQQLCDGIQDCEDFSDESENLCKKRQCADGYVKCDDGIQCVPKSAICSHYKPQCRDGSDEVNCPDRECLPGRTKCADGYQCVAKYNICDGWPNDCEDGSDEAPHICNETTSTY